MACAPVAALGLGRLSLQAYLLKLNGVSGALLQTCKIQGNEKMSEWITGHLKGKSAGVDTLPLLSNMYASSE
ncbi:hypothetical protein VIGAN_05041600 [Vigna angularis var. angularis]|uniref:Uncharacterized protein n=1 Tax=Vigna angularis var. angularis TaxID=157739 RepID=A0A0S3S2M6_PHAAN|nr:hypothetical protein VIGAN_05041600 [Vigna angularis var. angularis]